MKNKKPEIDPDIAFNHVRRMLGAGLAGLFLEPDGNCGGRRHGRGEKVGTGLIKEESAGRKSI